MSYAFDIASALRVDYGVDNEGARRICEDTGCSFGAAKDWLRGNNGPNGVYLVKLMACSPSVLAYVDRATGREEYTRIALEKVARLRELFAEPA